MSNNHMSTRLIYCENLFCFLSDTFSLIHPKQLDYITWLNSVFWSFSWQRKSDLHGPWAGLTEFGTRSTNHWSILRFATGGAHPPTASPAHNTRTLSQSQCNTCALVCAFLVTACLGGKKKASRISGGSINKKSKLNRTGLSNQSLVSNGNMVQTLNTTIDKQNKRFQSQQTVSCKPSLQESEGLQQHKFRQLTLPALWHLYTLQKLRRKTNAPRTIDTDVTLQLTF